MMKFTRRKLMQWAAGSAVGSTLFGGLLGRRASAQSVPFVDLSLAGVTGATPNGTGLHLLDQMGRIFSRGAAPPLGDASIIPCLRPSPYVAMVRMPAGSSAGAGLVALTAAGQFSAFGIFDSKGLEFILGRSSPLPVQPLPFVALAVMPTGQGLWALDLMGRVSTYGFAPDFGPGALDPCYHPSPYVAMVPTPTGEGLYALTMSGQIRTFGNALVFSPDPGHIAPCVDIARTPNGDGLWALDLLGNVHTYGGAIGDVTIAPCIIPTPYVAMIPTPSGFGLYALTMDGKVRTLGDALNFSAP